MKTGSGTKCVHRAQQSAGVRFQPCWVAINLNIMSFNSAIPCASDIAKAQSVLFSPRAQGNQFGLAEEMAKAGYRSVGDFYSYIQKIVTTEIEIAAVVGKFDLINSINNGITEPLDAITLPYLVPTIVVIPEFLDFATITFSIIAFEIPMALIG